MAPLTPFFKKSMGSKGLGPWWVQGEALVGCGATPRKEFDAPYLRTYGAEPWPSFFLQPHPIDTAAFAALMQPLGPYEPNPHLAVAVSGGADSLALALLARDWAQAGAGG